MAIKIPCVVIMGGCLARFPFPIPVPNRILILFRSVPPTSNSWAWGKLNQPTAPSVGTIGWRLLLPSSEVTNSRRGCDSKGILLGASRKFKKMKATEWHFSFLYLFHPSHEDEDDDIPKRTKTRNLCRNEYRAPDLVHPKASPSSRFLRMSLFPYYLSHFKLGFLLLSLFLTDALHE